MNGIKDNLNLLNLKVNPKKKKKKILKRESIRKLLLNLMNPKLIKISNGSDPMLMFNNLKKIMI